jgi:hypothetical protein
VGIDARGADLRGEAARHYAQDRPGRPPRRRLPEFKGNGGFDVKVGVTEGLTADFTYNTDFAQVEEDTQQVNLTRFTVQFPEKREFFLEGQGIFSFGGISTSRFLPTNPVVDDIPLLFFSRRIGLEGGQDVPIDVGGRMTGKVGPYSIGLLTSAGRSTEAGVDATNFARWAVTFCAERSASS